MQTVHRTKIAHQELCLIYRILVNNTDFGRAETLEAGGVEALKYCYEMNVFGHVKVTNAVPIMRKSGNGGQVTFIGSRRRVRQ
jgi:short-subunit dehydrogenase